jgi:hypothetical protein
MKILEIRKRPHVNVNKARRILILAVLTTILLLGSGLTNVHLPSVKAIGNTWYVDGTPGTDDGDHGAGPGADAFKTIQYAIDDTRVGSGDTINVAAGTYQEDITISKELALQGAGRTTTTILRNAATDTVVLIQASNVKVTGFKIDQGPVPYQSDYLVRVAYGGTLYQNIEVSDCHLTGAGYNAVEMYPDSVGHVYKVNDNIIEHYGGGRITFGVGPSGMGVGITFGNALDVEANRNTILSSELEWTPVFENVF